MALAWLVMLAAGAWSTWWRWPCGWSTARGWPRQLAAGRTAWLAVAFGWVVLLAAWLAATLLIAGRRRQPPAARSRYPPSFEERGDYAAMKPDDREHPLGRTAQAGPAGQELSALFLQGLTTTLRHLFGRKQTVQSPEERHEIVDPLSYRGVHRLNRDEQGRVKCVACFLCATACPAHCIDIVAAESPWPDRQKYPQGLQHRRAALYLLRHVRRGLPGGGHRVDQPLRPLRARAARR